MLVGWYERPVEVGTLYYGDCLDWLEKWPSESVDLVYLDPPFNSKTDYDISREIGSGTTAHMRAFSDTWHWDHAAERRVSLIERAVKHPAHRTVVAFRSQLGASGMMAYLSYMAERLTELRRLLKPTGSVYLHCDPSASHYLKVLMDGVFGPRQFLNEIIWKRTTTHSDAKRWGANHDAILFYAASIRAGWTWNQEYVPYDDDYLKRFNRVDPDGRRWQDDNLTAKGLSGGGYEYTYKGATSLWRVPPETMERLDREGYLHFTSTGGIRHKRYLDETAGTPVQGIWTDIGPINSQSKERLGYPTQKPLALLKRVLSASSNTGDIVLDPFCGCGTTIEAAHQLDRHWVGIDVSAHALNLIAEQRLPTVEMRVEGMPEDLHGARKLASANRLDFETWAVTRVRGLAPNEAKGRDASVEGRGMLLPFEGVGMADAAASRLVLAQVNSGKFSLLQLRDFCNVVRRECAALGIYITLDSKPTAAVGRELAGMGRVQIGSRDYPKVQMWSIRDYFEQRLPELPGMADPYTGQPDQPLLFQ